MKQHQVLYVFIGANGVEIRHKEFDTAEQAYRFIEENGSAAAYVFGNIANVEIV